MNLYYKYIVPGVLECQMIIIKTDKNDTNATFEIATILFNMELGEKAFNVSGDLDDRDDYHVLHKDGISYTIRGNEGNIVIMNNEVINNETYIEDLDKNLQKLDELYIKEHGNIQYYTTKSMDFTLVSEIYNENNARRIISSNGINPTKSCFKWKIIDRDIILPAIMDRKCSRDVWEHTFLTKYNTLIIDDCDIFDTNDKVTFFDDIPSIKHYNMAKRIVDCCPIIFERKTRSIDNTLRELSGVNIIKTDSSILQAMFPVYEEHWVNIKPMRISKNSKNSTLEHIYSLLLKEEENTENDFQGCPNDICHACGMYLYDYIYVMELVNHVCVCTKCFHNVIQYEKFSPKFDKVKVLKVKHPNDISDVIKRISKSELRDLLLELSGNDVTIDDKNGSIITPNYMGSGSIYPVLLKLVPPPENKKLFVCHIIC